MLRAGTVRDRIASEGRAVTGQCVPDAAGHGLNGAGVRAKPGTRNRMLYDCAVCGREFEFRLRHGRQLPKNHRKTCSHGCSTRYVSSRSWGRRRKEARCAACGRKFAPGRGGKKTCSEDCRRARRRAYDAEYKRGRGGSDG